MQRSFKKAALSLVAVAACGASLAISANAAPQSKEVGAVETSTRACFRPDRIDGYAPVRVENGVDAVNLRSGNDVFQLKFIGPCPSVRDAIRIAVENRGISRFICSPSDADVISYSRISGPEHCAVSAVRKFEPAEIAAMPAAEKP